MEKYNLTFPEENIWLVENFYNLQKINIISGSLIINKGFDFEHAEKAVNKFVELNDGMRIRITVEDSIPMQYFADYTYFKADRVSASHKTEEEINKIKDEYISTEFDVIDSPLFKYLLIDKGEGKGEIFLKAHHLICDGWSTSQMVMKVSDIYDKLLVGDNNFEEYPSYVEYIKKEEEYKNSEKYSKDEEYWKEYLKDFTETVSIKNTNTESTVAKRYSVKLNKKLNQLIFDFCKENRLSPYTVFMTALAVYLERTTEKSDLIIGTPILNRSNFAEKKMQGMFVSTMPVRFKIDEAKTFKELCQENVKDTMNSFRHQRFPYSKTVENARRENGIQDNLYKIMLSYQNARAKFEKEDSYRMSWNFSKNIQSELEIHIIDLNDDGILEVDYDYNTSLFEDVEIKYISKRIETIIYDGIVNNKTIETIEIMPEKEKNKILYEFNDTKRDYPKDKTVIDLFEEQVKKTPDKVSLVFEDKELTYEELNKRANILSQLLIENGVNAGDCVGISIDKSFELIIAIISVLKIGAYYLPIELNYSREKKEYLIKDTKAKIIIKDNLEAFSIPSIFINEVNWNTQKNVEIKRPKTYDQDSPNCVLYTSGTTGNPKGAVVINKNIVKLVKNPDYMEFDENDVILQAASTSFDVSLFEFWGSLLNGETCALITKNNLLDFEYLNNYINNKKINIAWITAALFNQMIDSKIGLFSSLKIVLSGGDRMSLKHVNLLREKYKNLKIINCYGPTECVTFTNTFEVKHIMKERIPLGKAISNTYGYVIDTKFRLLPLYVEGEYIIGGDSVGLEYINNKELSKEKFVNDIITNKGRMYKTGDIVRMLNGGLIDFIGRRDNQVKIRGYRIELDEIKHAFMGNKDIQDVALFLYTDKNDEKKIASFYVANRKVSLNEIKALLKDKLTTYLIPNFIKQVEKIPLNQNGKININELEKLIIEKEEENNEMPKYEGLSKKIYNVFRDVINKDEIYPNDNFFEIGGDSLIAIKVITELQNENINITFSDLYKYPTINSLTDMISKDITKASLSEDLAKEDFTSINKLLDKNILNRIRIIDTGNYLLTGATGFLGAHILSYIIDNTEKDVYCLVRNKNEKTPEKYLKEKLQFFFGNKYDKEFNNRIKVVEGDLGEKDLVRDEDVLNNLINNTTTIINSAAYVKHYGDYELFKKINCDGVENLIEFALKYNKRLFQISTLSVSGNILEVGQIEQNNIKEGTIFNENKLYIGQNLDNVYAYTKFLGEKRVYEGIAKGLDAKIIRMGNLTSRYSDGKFQPNVEENAFANRLKTIINLGVLPDNLMNFNVEFTPIDEAAKAIYILTTVDNNYNTYHLFNHNHIVMSKLKNILKECGYNLKDISKKQMTELIDHYSRQEKGYEVVKGIIQDLTKNKELEYKPNTIIKSDFTINLLEELGFKWPIIDEEYILKYINYLKDIGFLKGEN